MNARTLPPPAAAASLDRARATAAPGEVSISGTLQMSAWVAGGLTVAAGAVGAVIGVALAASARRWLAYPFAGIPARPGEAVAIFVHNVRALLAVVGLLLVAQCADWGTNSGPGRVHQTIRAGGEALLAAGVAANVVVVGASLGAYGPRMVRALLPHGPIELAAYALALAVYLQGRSKPLPARHALAILALSVGLLAVAAALETFVNV